MTLKKERR